MSQQPIYDVLVIGAGHNGLVCAGYLARAGYRVKVVERRGVVGGAAVSEEFHPGFRNSVCSYVVSLLHPKVIADLGLHDYGLEILDRPGGSLAPLPGGQCLSLPRDDARAMAEIARYSPRDARSYEAFHGVLERTARVLRGLVLETPPNIGGGWGDLWRALTAGNRLRKLDASDQAAFAHLMTKSVGDYLDSWFEFDGLKGVYGFEGIVGNMVSPYAPGSAYVLLHHYFGEVNGRVGAWGHARGGMGAITRAMARSAEACGVEIELEAPVEEVLLDDGRAAGVRLADGRTIRARAVAANVNPKLLYLRLIDAAALPAEFLRTMRAWRCRSGTFRMNVALSELPRFDGMPGGDVHELMSGTIDICPSLAYMERAYDDAKAGGWAREPIISMCIPSTIDDTLAPRGAHVASLFCQHFHPELSGGRTWDDVKEEVADLIIGTVDRYAPNFKRAVVGRQVLSPLDLERDFGLIGGDIFHGALHLDQIYSLRPAAGYADYRAPIGGLYLCGSGAHPGGGVSGVPGHNAAREIARDFRRRRVG
ncbi:MAG: NAD(P)/FAD-dependent oxidoreductase [Alphaproteobacteria bacterium]|nr:MAG: NAD(P)/FAD-dependent oxidoreductase [Alphaproteobacteria bacterium]